MNIIKTLFKGATSKDTPYDHWTCYNTDPFKTMGIDSFCGVDHIYLTNETETVRDRVYNLETGELVYAGFKRTINEFEDQISDLIEGYEHEHIVRRQS